MTAKTRIPKFSSEAQERKFWEAHDSANLVDWSKATRVRLPNLKPSTKAFRCGCRFTPSSESRRRRMRAMSPTNR